MKTKTKPKPKQLTESQIERIADHLHNSVQFFNDFGQPDNNQVLAKIESSLRGFKFNTR